MEMKIKEVREKSQENDKAATIQYTTRKDREDAKILAGLARHEDWHVRLSVSQNLMTPTHSLNDLARDTNQTVRESVAKHPNIPQETLAVLSSDEDVNVRQAATSNPKYTKPLDPDIFPEGGFRFPPSEDMKQDVMDRLEAGVKALFDTDRYKDYLKTAAKFHEYSSSNALLIWLQKPDATCVAGFRAWQEKFERTVKKGEKGIRIITPRISKGEEKDPATGEKKFVERLSFGVGVVFDVSQTEGKDLPLTPFDRNLPDGTYEHFEELKAAIEKTAGIPVDYVKNLDGASGVYRTNDKNISVLDNLSQEGTLSVLIHETAHSRLHADRTELKARGATRRTLEVEAESVAFIASEHFGIKSEDSSFAYVAGWSKDKTLPELKASHDRIQKEAHSLITDIEMNLGITPAQRQALTENKVKRQPSYTHKKRR